MASGDPIQIGSDLLLVHEGQVDAHVIGQLTREHEIKGFQFLPMDGQTKMRAFLKGLSLSPHFRSPVPGFSNPVRGLAIILDAEANAIDTFQAIHSALTTARLPAPQAAGEIAEGALRVGVFVIPDNQSPGKIETLCLNSVRTDPAWACLDVFFACVRENGGTWPANMDKARAQAFLATRPKPDLPVGLAALEGYWDYRSDCFAPLISFLRRLAQ